MAEPVVALLAAAPSGAIVDGTLGGAGHSAALVEATERLIIGVDQDTDALAEAARRMAAYDEGRFVALHGNFRDLPDLLNQAELPDENGIAGILLDLTLVTLLVWLLLVLLRLCPSPRPYSPPRNRSVAARAKRPGRA